MIHNLLSSGSNFRRRHS